jgi:hypothetical protein
MDRVEFEFPDPDKDEKKAAAEDDSFEVEIVDDTPPKDQGRKPADPPTEVTDDELEGYSEKVKKRIQHFTRGYHDERRAKEAALREREEALRLAQSIIEENKKLKQTVNQNQEALLEQAKRAATVELEQAKAMFRAAYEEGDPDKVTAAQESLTSAKLKADRVANFQLPSLQEETPDVESKQTVPVKQSVSAADPRVTAWHENNPWFGSDDEMTSFALGLHQKLIKQGVDPQSDEYYDSINRRMRQVFPDQFEEVEPEEKPRSKPVVAPATRTTAPKKIVLTKSQQAIAKRLGLTLEQYARQVAEDMRKQNG